MNIVNLSWFFATLRAPIQKDLRGLNGRDKGIVEACEASLLRLIPITLTVTAAISFRRRSGSPAECRE